MQVLLQSESEMMRFTSVYLILAIAAQAAGLTIMGSDLRGLSDAFALSRATMRVIRQNLAWAFGYNLVLIPLAVGVAGVGLDPILAAAAMATSSVTVVVNALRLRRWRASARRAT